MNERTGSTRLLNTRTGTVSPLPASSPCGGAGSCLFGDCVYVFGGHTGSAINTSKKFDLKKKVWTEINSMPVTSCYNTASVISGKIYVTGFHMPNVIAYDEKSNSFAVCLSLAVNTYKRLCEDWIVANGELLKFCDGSFTKQGTHSLSLTNLLTSSTFKRNGFLYCIDGSLKLSRINTRSRSIELVEFQ